MSLTKILTRVMLFASPLGRLLMSLLGWVFVAPVAMIVPKNRSWVGVIGRKGGWFLDNAKYFFLQGKDVAPDLHFVFITEQHAIYKQITTAQRTAVHYPSIAAIWFLLRCGTVIVDELSWYQKGRFFLLIRTKIIQIWHGVGFKFAEMNRWKLETGDIKWSVNPFIVWLRLLTYRIIGRLSRYAAVIATSEYTRDHMYKGMFLTSTSPIVGYPRNDFARSLHGNEHRLAWSNVDAELQDNLTGWVKSKRKLILIAPTFRDSGSIPMELDDTIFSLLNDFAAKNNVEFIFKLHPADRTREHSGLLHIHMCDRVSDIYPVLPFFSALVSDYSSIAMDFLFIDKPLLFLIPDHDDYIARDRQLQHDPRIMTPTLVVKDWPSLLITLQTELIHDSFRSERDLLLRKLFADIPQAEASLRLITFMRTQGWLPRKATRKTGSPDSPWRL